VTAAAGELGARGDVQLLEDVANVGLDGGLRDEEALGDLTVGESLLRGQLAAAGTGRLDRLRR
jgi:hypothetical protein